MSIGRPPRAKPAERKPVLVMRGEADPKLPGRPKLPPKPGRALVKLPPECENPREMLACPRPNEPFANALSGAMAFASVIVITRAANRRYDHVRNTSSDGRLSATNAFSFRSSETRSRGS